MSRAPKKTSISRSAAFKPVRVAALRRGEWCPILVQIYSSICTWLSLQTDYAIRPSWTPLCRGVNNWRNSPAKSGRLIGCAPGYQVTPRLRMLFHAGASGDSSPSRAFPRRGIRWLLAFASFSAPGHQLTPCTARAPYRLEWVRERSPLHTTAADVRLVSCKWEGILYTPQTAVGGLVLCELESSVFQTWQPLMRGWYCGNEWRAKWLCFAHSRTPLWDSGPCGFICGDMRTLSFCICPRLSAPPWKGNMRSRADVLSCRFDGWEECGRLVGMSS